MRKLLLVAMSLLMLQQALAFDLIMPNQIVSGEPFEFTIVMDDPRLQKLVHTIIVRCHGQCPIIRRKSDKHIHWEYNYSGEKEVVFEGVGFWREYEDTTEGEFTITLLADIEKQREMFADMTTYMEDVAFIRRGISVLPVSFSADLPEYDCDWKLENFDTVTFPPDFRCFGKGDYYSEFKFMGGMAGRGTCTNEDPEYMACNVGFPRSLYENPEEDMEVGQEDFGTGGEGYYYYKKSQSVAYYDSDGNKVYNLEPFLRYAVLDGMVIHSGDIRKQVMIKTDDPDAEFEDIKQEMFSMIRSFKWVGKGGGQGHEITKKINLPDSADSLKVWGTIADADHNPMPFVDMQLELKGKTFTGKTDINGDFSIPITGLELSDSEDAKLFVTFSYVRDGVSYFKLYLLNGGSYKELYYGKKIKIEKKEDVELHLVMDGSPDRDAWLKPNQPLANLKHWSPIYYHLHEAVEFTLIKLGEKMDYDMPVEVLLGNTDKETLYTPTGSMIKIAIDDCGYSSTNRPDNREYHEFMHAVMYDVYGAWPEDRGLAGTKNHDGYLNPSTADSYMEGFAEFMAMAISKEIVGERSPDLYADFGSFEKNYHTWDSNGYAEELAVASLLWDLYDDKVDAGDTLSLSITELWNVLKVKRKNFHEYYEALLLAFPRQQDGIKKVFEEHGFFADTTPGNGKWDRFEPIRDVNKNGRHDAGEFFVDLGAQNSTEEIKYKPGLMLGKAADYNRSSRTSAVRVPGAYLAVDDGAKFFKVTIGDSSYVTEAREGMIYVNPLPSGYDEDIRIEPLNLKGEEYSINSIELSEKLLSGEKTFDSHEFKAQGEEEYYGLVDEPRFVKNDIDADVEVRIDESDEQKDSPTAFPWGFMAFALVVGGGGLLLFKSGAAREMVVKSSKKAGSDFQKHGVPALKHAAKKTGEFTVEAAKLTAKYTVKGVKLAAHHTKNAYEGAKPHVARAVGKVKEKISKK